MVIKIVNPSTEEVIGEFVENTNNEINLILEKSKIAQKNWFLKSKEERILVMKNMSKSFENNQDKLIETINEECGFAKAEIQDIIFDVLDGFSHYIKVYEEKKILNFQLIIGGFQSLLLILNFIHMALLLRLELGITHYGKQ